MRWARSALAASLAWVLVSFAPLVAAEPQRVLIIHSFGRDFAPFNAIASAFRTELVRQLRQPVAFHDVSLAVERGPLEDDRPFIDFLRDRCGDQHPRLVVTIGAPAALFQLRTRQRLFPEAPVLITGIDQRLTKGMALQAHDRVVSIDMNYRTVLEGIRTLLPDTKLVAIVQGASAHESARIRMAETELQSSGVRTVALGGLTHLLSRKAPGTAAQLFDVTQVLQILRGHLDPIRMANETLLSWPFDVRV